VGSGYTYIDAKSAKKVQSAIDIAPVESCPICWKHVWFYPKRFLKYEQAASDDLQIGDSLMTLMFYVLTCLRRGFS
jgi:hypothetical protein